MSDLDDKDFEIRAPYVQKILELEECRQGVREAGRSREIKKSCG